MRNKIFLNRPSNDEFNLNFSFCHPIDLLPKKAISFKHFIDLNADIF